MWHFGKVRAKDLWHPCKSMLQSEHEVCGAIGPGAGLWQKKISKQQKQAKRDIDSNKRQELFGKLAEEKKISTQTA